MSFTILNPAEIFAAQRQFIAVMEAPRDFEWWAETLITEETKELKQAHAAPRMDQQEPVG